MFLEFYILSHSKVLVNENELPHFSIRLHIALLNLLDPTGGLIVTVVYYTSIGPRATI